MKLTLATFCMILLFESGAPVLAQTPESPIILLPQSEEATPPPESNTEALQSFGDRTSIEPTQPKVSVRRMPLIGAISDPVVRLEGESNAVDLSLFVPTSVPAAGFQLVLRTSINVLPERSSVTVIVNGTALPPVRPEPLDGFLTVPLDGSVLKAGENSVSISSKLFHRIYCGPEASFALWVEIDTSLSGILLPPEYRPEPEDLVQLIAAQSVLPQGLSIQVADGLDPQMLGLVTARILALKGVRAGGVTLGSPYSPATAQDDLVRIALLAGEDSMADVVTGGDGAAVLRVRPGATTEATSIALSNVLPTQSMEKDTIAVLEPGVPTTLRDLGRDDTALRGHYILHNVVFRLPVNWLVLGPQKGRLTLAYGFAEGLAEGAILLIKINGVTVRLLPLDVEGGDGLAPLTIGFLASLLRPGVNVLALEAIIPGNPVDLPCINSEQPVLTIKGGSTLVVPASPKMRFPGMERVLATATSSEISRGVDGAQPVTDPLSPFAAAFGANPLAMSQDTTLRLRLISAVDADMIRPRNFDLPRGLLTTALPTVAPTGLEGVPAVADDDTPVKSLFDLGWMYHGVRGLGATLRATIRAGDPPLTDWIVGKTGSIILVQPDPDAPYVLLVLMAPGVTEADASAAIFAARSMPGGPTGRLAILSTDGTWQSWRPASTVPLLLEPLTVANVAFVVGTYASWSPLLFTVALLGLAGLAAIVAIAFVLSTRGRRKQ